MSIPDFDHWNIDCMDLEISDVLLGKGCGGDVWVGRWRSTPVAVKKFKKNEYALHEYSVLRCMHHPNIVQMLGISLLLDGNYVLVLEQLVGITLDQLLERKKQKGYAWTLDVTCQILLALRYMHEHRPEGVAHRDIKPSNIFLTYGVNKNQSRKVRVKILDFGLAVMGEPSDDHPRKVGTRVFMGPELYRTDPPLSLQLLQKGDVYAVAIVIRMLWEHRYTNNLEWRITPRTIQILFTGCLQNDALERPLPSQLLFFLTHTSPCRKMQEKWRYDWHAYFG